MANHDDIINPIESDKFPGYYVSRKYPLACISRSGELILPDRRYGESQYRKTYGTPMTSGYLRATVYDADDTSYHRTTVHRISAYAFKRKISPEQNQVNHKDGIRDNNDESNLEWCTSLENAIHAIALNKNSSKYKGKIEVYDRNDGSVIKYLSTVECASTLNMNQDSLTTLLTPTCKFKVMFGRYLIKRENDEWPEVDWSKVVKRPRKVDRPLIAIEIDVHSFGMRKVIYPDVSTASRDLNISNSRIGRSLKSDINIVVDGYIFKPLDTFELYPLYEDILTDASSVPQSINRYVYVFGVDKKIVKIKLIDHLENIKKFYTNFKRDMRNDKYRILKGYHLREIYDKTPWPKE